MSPFLNRKGQASIEFALVGAGFISLVVALALIWRALESGLFVEHAVISASHHVNSVMEGVLSDAFLY